jgi:predicted nuclease of predicted toxin-antitoxin system
LVAARKNPKPKLLLDECLPPRGRFPKLNEYCIARHLKGDFHESGISDEAVFELACKEEMILVTYNKRDFSPLIQSDKMSIIAIGTGLSDKVADTRVTAYIKKIKPHEFKGQLKVIT